MIKSKQIFMSNNSIKRTLVTMFYGAVISCPSLLYAQNTYDVAEIESNTEASDIATTLFKGNLVVMNNCSSGGGIVRKDKVTKRSFYDLYVLNEEDLNSFDLLKQKFNDGPLSFNSDETELFYSRNNEKSGESGVINLGIHSFKLNDFGEWEESADFIANDNDYSVTHPALSKDGQKLYFSSDMPGGQGGFDLYVSERKNGKWVKPVNLGNDINTSGNEVFPFSANNGSLYFSSDKLIGLGGLDVFSTSKTLNGYSKPKNLGNQVNSAKDDFGFILDESLVSESKSGYFTSDRNGTDDIYTWKSNVKDLFITGKLVDNKTGKAISNAILEFKYKDEVVQVLTDSEGNYKFPAERGEIYTITTDQDDYLPFETTVKSDLPLDQSNHEKNISLIRQPSFDFSVYDSKSGKPLDKVKVTITDHLTGKSVTEYSDEKGNINMDLIGDQKIGDTVGYSIKLEKPGFLSKTVDFDSEVDETGKFNLPKNVTTLVKMEVGIDIAKDYDLKPIYYAYNDFSIQPEAAIELDKIVKVMLDNPDLTLLLKSHTDSRGSDSYNKRLSQKRAKSAADYINKKLSVKGKVKFAGVGESEPVNGCTNGVKCSDEEYAVNRRTEFIVQ